MNHGLSLVQINIIKNLLAPYSNKIDFVGLFGSRAAGNYKPNSDIDLVIYGSLDEKTLNRIYTLFKDSSLSLKVDVHAYELIDYSPLKEHIDNCMVLLFNHENLK